MALTPKELDDMQSELHYAFNRSVEWANSYAARPSNVSQGEAYIAMGSTATALLAIENEQRLRAEYNPRKTLQKD
jgi:hypothetical protein